MTEKDFGLINQLAESREDFGDTDYKARVSGLRMVASVLYGFIYGNSLRIGVDL